MVLKLKRLMPDIPQTRLSLITELRSVRSQPIGTPADLAMRNVMTNRIEARITALDKIDQYTPAVDFTPSESQQLCSIIFTYRPALLVENCEFPSPVPASPDINWDNVLSPHRSEIEKAIESVGRIEFSWDNGDEWAMATGFLVAENIMMTCRHVAQFFCDYCDSTDQWTFKTYTKKRRIDYCQEKDPTRELEYKIKEIVKVYDNLDIALFKVTKTTKVSWSDKRQKHPEPLVLADTMPNPANKLYTIGYPNADPTEPNSNMEAVLEGILGVKRLQPGLARSGYYANPEILYHDCSVTYGNSGSCVIDIDTNQVIGLQYKGIYTDEWNEAVALPNLNAGIKNELKQYGIQFA
jgi:hypothetical protein